MLWGDMGDVEILLGSVEMFLGGVEMLGVVVELLLGDYVENFEKW